MRHEGAIGMPDDVDSLAIDVVVVPNVGDQAADVTDIVDTAPRKIAAGRCRIPEASAVAVHGSIWGDDQNSCALDERAEPEILFLDEPVGAVAMETDQQRRWPARIVSRWDLDGYRPIPAEHGARHAGERRRSVGGIGIRVAASSERDQGEKSQQR